MPTAIEKQIENENVIKRVEELEGEYRPSEPASLDASPRNVAYVLFACVLVIVIAYWVVDRWETVQALFQPSQQMEQAIEPISNTPELIPEVPFSPEPLGGQVERLEPIKPVSLSPAMEALPVLAESDALFREQWADLWSDNKITSWSGAEQLVRKATVVVDNLSQGKIVRNLLGIFALESPFMVKLVSPANGHEGSVDIYQLDPAGYRRYSSLVAAFVAVDTDELINFYLHLRPLFHQAYLELGYPEAEVDTIFRGTLQKIQSAPILDAEVLLVRPKVMYQFRDQQLEGRSALDKQLFRMGPENMRLLQQKAKELEVAFSQALK